MVKIRQCDLCMRGFDRVRKALWFSENKVESKEALCDNCRKFILLKYANMFKIKQ